MSRLHLRPPPRLAGLASVLVLALGACSEPTAPEADLLIDLPILADHLDGEPDPGAFVNVCKEAYGGTFTFTVAVEGEDGGELLVASPFELPASSCITVWHATDQLADPTTLVIEEVQDPDDGYDFDYVDVNSALDGVATLQTPKVKVRAQYFHSVQTFFYNRKTDGHEPPPPPPPADCGVCKGKVTELTLRNDGPAGFIEVKQKKDGIVIFSGMVPAGETFTFQGQDKNGTMGTEIHVYVDGQLATKIHTSCSRPIGPGLISGDFTVVGGASLEGGPLCPVDTPPPPPEGCGCEGKVDNLTLRNDGPAAFIEVKQKKGDVVVFSGMVGAGENFSFTGQDKKGTLGTEIHVYVDGQLATKIHTSCSRPIGPGLVSGNFTVVEGTSLKGGALCPVEPRPEDCDLCADGAKPAALTMEYSGESCDDTFHHQDAGKVKCEGDPGMAPSVRIKAYHKGDEIWFDGTVPLDGSFTLEAANGGKDKLASNTKVEIYALDGTLLQKVEFHTSCSQPLLLGDRFGALVLTGFTPET